MKLPVLRHDQILDLTDSLELAAGDVFVKIPEMLLEVVEGFSLCPVIEIILKITEPGAVFFPLNDFYGWHDNHFSEKHTPITKMRIPAVSDEARSSIKLAQ